MMPKNTKKKMKFNNKVVDMTNIAKEENKVTNSSDNIVGTEPEVNKEETPKPPSLPANSSSGLGLCDN